MKYRAELVAYLLDNIWVWMGAAALAGAMSHLVVLADDDGVLTDTLVKFIAYVCMTGCVALAQRAVTVTFWRRAQAKRLKAGLAASVQTFTVPCLVAAGSIASVSFNDVEAEIDPAPLSEHFIIALGLW